MSSHIITPGPYRATKLWNEVTKLFRAGMPLRKHRQHFRVHGSCFSATAAVDWLHELLRNNSNFGPDVTRQQTVQLLKKFLKNHVIEDVKGRWGSEELEDNGHIYRFPSSSPLKPLPRHPASVKKSFSLHDKEGFFRLRSAKSTKRLDKETLENVDPLEPGVSEEAGLAEVQRRELTDDDVLEVWRDVTLTHLQKILGMTALEDVLDPRHVNPQNIVYNMTKVNKHGVVTLEDKTDDLPHWVLSAMKCLANWPKSDSSQPSYPGFERDVFKTVSDYFNSLPQPLLTFQFYELFVNVLVLSGYLVAPQRGKRKCPEAPAAPPPAKTPHVGVANLFRSTECLLLSLLRKEGCDEGDSPMKEVFGARGVKSRLAALRGGVARRGSLQAPPPTRRVTCGDAAALGGSCLSLAQSESGAAALFRLRPRSCSLETILDNGSAPPLSQATALASCGSDSCQGNGTPSQNTPDSHQGNDNTSQDAPDSCQGNGATSHNSPDSFQGYVLPPQSSPDSLSDSGSASQSQVSAAISTPSSSSHSRHSLALVPTTTLSVSHRPRLQRPKSVGNCADLIESREKSASCFSINAPVAEITMRPELHPSSGWLGRTRLHGSSVELRPRPRRCLSSTDLTRPRPGLAGPGPDSTGQRPGGQTGPSGPPPVSLTGPGPSGPPSVSLTEPSGPPPVCLTGPGPSRPPPVSLTGPGPSRPPPVSLTGPGPSRPPPVSLTSRPRRLSPDNSLLQPQLERVAVEALQLCCLLLPPARRRKLQLLMRMMSRMSQNVDMPRLHDAIGTRTLMVHAFSRCVLSCVEEVDLDELLATRLVSFLLDHHQDILSVPVYLNNAVTDHLTYLRTVQIPAEGVPGEACGAPVPVHAFCRQISSREFEEQRLTVSQAAIAELLEMLLADANMNPKERRKKLRQFQKQYPDIFSRRFPTAESQAQVLEDKPKIKPPLLLAMKKTKAFSIRN